MSKGLLVIAGLILSLCLGAGCSSLATVNGGASVQYADRLETQDRERLVSLFLTDLEGSQVEMVWMTGRLPCAPTHYRFSATGASIDSSADSSSEARVQLLSESLPHGIHCGQELPPYVSRGATTIAVAPVQPEGGTGSPVLRYSARGTTLESYSHCMTLSTACNGRYLLTARFSVSPHEITLVYGFILADAKNSTSTAPVNSGHKVQSCPVL
jgi:hypothetical protein